MVAGRRADGPPGARLARLEPLAGLQPVLCVPATPLPTVTARQVLPAMVPHADAAANSARAALLVAALTRQSDLLMDATEDFLHQGYRAAAMPATTRLIAALRAAGLPAVVSGAGPAVLVLGMAGGPGPGAPRRSRVPTRRAGGCCRCAWMPPGPSSGTASGRRAPGRILPDTAIITVGNPGPDVRLHTPFSWGVRARPGREPAARAGGAGGPVKVASDRAARTRAAQGEHL